MYVYAYVNMQCTAAHCNTLWITATKCNTLQHTVCQVPVTHGITTHVRTCPQVDLLQCLLQCVAVCCSVLQCVAVCCSVLCGSRDETHIRTCPQVSVFQLVAVCCSVVQCVAVCCNLLQCLKACCSVSQCVAVCRRPPQILRSIFEYQWFKMRVRERHIRSTHIYEVRDSYSDSYIRSSWLIQWLIYMKFVTHR